jgi:hypothetical protein
MIASALSATIRWAALFAAAGLAAACASDGTWMDVTSEASGSAYFSLSRPEVRAAADHIEISGRVCRRGRATLLSPAAVRLEHINADGLRTEVARASLAAIHRDADQACTDFATDVRWSIMAGDVVRACFDDARPCPSEMR